MRLSISYLVSFSKFGSKLEIAVKGRKARQGGDTEMSCKVAM